MAIENSKNSIICTMNSPPQYHHHYHHHHHLPNPCWKPHHRKRRIPLECSSWYALLVLIVTWGHQNVCVQGAIPNAKLEIGGTPPHSNMLITMTTSFGRAIDSLKGTLRIPQQEGDWYFCNLTTTDTTMEGDDYSSSTSFTADDILLVPRGQCTFEQKTRLAATLGAGGILIYNTLESRYGWEEEDDNNNNKNNTNDASGKVIYPTPKQDYECDESWGGGNVWIESYTMPMLDPPRYNRSVHDSYLTFTHPHNVCHLPHPEKCVSQKCLIVGPPTSPPQDYEGLDYVVQACCAWDVLVDMKGDSTLSKDESSMTKPIVAMFVTMAQSDILLTHDGSTISIQRRDTPLINGASLLLWIWGTCIVLGAALWSAKEYYRAKQQLILHFEGLRHHYPPQDHHDQEENVIAVSATSTANHPPHPNRDAPHGEQSQSQQVDNDGIIVVPCITDEQEAGGGADEGVLQLTNQISGSSPSLPPIPNQEENPTTTSNNDIVMNTKTNNHDSHTTRSHPPPLPEANPTLDLNVWHALGFVIMASSTLLLLFYFKFYDVVTVIYGFACCTGSMKLIFLPLYQKVGKWIVCQDHHHPLTHSRRMCPPPDTKLVCGCELQDVLGKGAVLLALASSLTWSITWLYVGFTTYQPAAHNPFYWISQNIFGAIVCVDFLSIIRLNSIKVATALLVVAFVYDIFFVFLTPLFLDSGESIMVTVATGGGGSSSSDGKSADYCEKYPDDSACWGNEVLPMVFTIPRINDYRGGSSLLGLGDILLPGLLIAFGARLDAAKRLSSHVGLEVSHIPHQWYQGYLCPLVVAYAVGLMGASVAVYIMERGQPALLYIIPTTLGTIVMMGHSKYGELGELWKGPQELKWADNLVRYSRTLTSSTYQVYENQARQLLHHQQQQQQQSQSPPQPQGPPPGDDESSFPPTAEQQTPHHNSDVEMSPVTTTTTISNHTTTATTTSHEESPPTPVIT